eukprot:5346527-Prymnesium_polylepis.1
MLPKPVPMPRPLLCCAVSSGGSTIGPPVGYGDGLEPRRADGRRIGPEGGPTVADAGRLASISGSAISVSASPPRSVGILYCQACRGGACGGVQQYHGRVHVYGLRRIDVSPRRSATINGRWPMLSPKA